MSVVKRLHVRATWARILTWAGADIGIVKQGKRRLTRCKRFMRIRCQARDIPNHAGHTEKAELIAACRKSHEKEAEKAQLWATVGRNFTSKFERWYGLTAPLSVCCLG